MSHCKHGRTDLVYCADCEVERLKVALVQAEQERDVLKQQREGVMDYLSNVHMTASGEPAMIFMELLVGLFEQNGGKNFLTLTVEKPDKSKRYSITIQNLNGELSPAEKMDALEKERNALLEANKKLGKLNRQLHGTEVRLLDENFALLNELEWFIREYPESSSSARSIIAKIKPATK